MDARKDRLLGAMLTANSLKEAAQASGIPYEACRKWLRDPEFQLALTDARQATLKETLIEVEALARLARETLRAIMEDTSAPAYSRVQACTAALAHADKVMQMADIEERLAAIEQHLAAKAA